MPTTLHRAATATHGSSVLLVGLLVVGALSQPANTDGNANVFGSGLQKCDRSAVSDPKYPSTGYMRENVCTATSSDAGSHYVCVNLTASTSPSGKPYSPFWTKTGQAGSAEEASTWPLPGPWCICMWAYASMYEMHPEFEQMLWCPAVNEWVVDDYDLNVPKQRAALESVCRHCDLETSAVKSTIRARCQRARVLA